MVGLKSNYKTTQPKTTSTITDNKGIITHEIELKEMDLIFDEKAKFIKKEKLKNMRLKIITIVP